MHVVGERLHVADDLGQPTERLDVVAEDRGAPVEHRGRELRRSGHNRSGYDPPLASQDEDDGGRQAKLRLVHHRPDGESRVWRRRRLTDLIEFLRTAALAEFMLSNNYRSGVRITISGPVRATKITAEYGQTLSTEHGQIG